MSFLPLVFLVLLSTYLVIRFRKRISEINSSIAIQQQTLQERQQETAGIRQEIEKNLSSILNSRVTFTLVYDGDKGFIASIPLTSESKEEKISFYEEIKKDKVDWIVSILSKSP